MSRWVPVSSLAGTPGCVPGTVEGALSAPNGARGSEPRIRETLTRVLAREGRSTLARVELAASELMRFDASPALADRLTTIREATREIDALLGKIDLLAEPARGEHRPALELGAIWRDVLGRVAPTLAARGVEVVLADEPGAGPAELDPEARSRACVALPRSTCEAVLCAFVRLVLPVAPRRGQIALEIARVGGAVRVAARVGPGDAEVGSDPSQAVPLASAELDRPSLIELEVLLAEWGGAFDHDVSSGLDDAFRASSGSASAHSPVRGPSGRVWAFWLPEAQTHA